MIKLVLVLVVTLAISACVVLEDTCISGCMAGEKSIINAEATRLTRDQVIAHVSSRTEVWWKGGGYYNPNGDLRVKWRKAWDTGTWTVSADGEVCNDIPKLGRHCHYYMDNAGAITMVSGGKSVGIREMLEGNKLRGL
jgi:hypothetical protein